MYVQRYTGDSFFRKMRLGVNSKDIKHIHVVYLITPKSQVKTAVKG